MAAADRTYGVLAVAVTLELGVEVRQGLVPDAAQAPRGEAHAPTLLLDQARLAELAGKASQSLQGPGVFFAQQLAGTVYVHLRQRSRAGGAGQHLFELLEVRQLADDRAGGPRPKGRPRRSSSPEVPSRCPRSFSSSTRKATSSSRSASESSASFALCSGVREPSRATGRRHLAGQRRQQLVKVFRAPGDEVPVTLHELLEVGLDVGARLAALDQAVELGQHLPGALEHLRRSVGDGRLELGEGVAGQFRPLAAGPVEQLS